MIVRLFLIISLLLKINTAFSEKLKSFSLEIYVENYKPSMSIEVLPYLSDSNYAKIVTKTSLGSIIKFRGKAIESAGFILFYEDKAAGKFSQSALFFLSEGINRLHISTDTIRNAFLRPLNVKSRRNILKNEYLTSLVELRKMDDDWMESLNILYDSLSGDELQWELSKSRALQKKNKEQLKTDFLYLLEKDNYSKIGLTLLLEYFDDAQILNRIDWEKQLKQRESEIIVQQVISKTQKVARLKIGNDLSRLHFFKPDNTLKQLQINELLGDSLTLVDFWFSKCGACIRQFGILNSLYLANKKNGFKILSVTIDEGSELQNCFEILKKKNIDWPLLKDDKRLVASYLGFESFPSNILLNKHGEIVALNIEPYELQEFLHRKKE